MNIAFRATRAAFGLLLLSAGAAPALAQAEDYGWTGFYVGGQLGYGFHKTRDNETVEFDTDLNGEFGDTVRTAAGADAFSPGFCGGPSFGPRPGDCDNDDKDGTSWAVHAGFDYQMGALVVGAVGEYGRADVEDSVSAFSTTPAFYTLTRRLRDNAALRARVGGAFGNTLVYATGGGAWGKIRNSFRTNNAVNSFTNTGNEDAWGYTYGGGIEQRVAPNFSIGAQYLFTSLEDDDFRVRAQGPAPATNPFIRVNSAGTDFRRSQERFNTHSVRVTANFRF